MAEAEHKKKNYWRRLEAHRVKEQRIVTGYVELKYPEVYKEAIDFYQFLSAKHPEKKDLRKTNEFEMLKQGIPEQTMKKYYKRKTKGPSNPSNEVSSKKDNMELIIPLMKIPVQTQTAEIESSSGEILGNVIEPSGEIPVQTQTVEIESSSGEIPVQTQTVEIESSSGEIPVQTQTAEIEPLLGQIPDEVIEEIMSGLREDPDLQAMFEDIDIDIDIEEISPLESELLYW